MKPLLFLFIIACLVFIGCSKSSPDRPLPPTPPDSTGTSHHNLRLPKKEFSIDNTGDTTSRYSYVYDSQKRLIFYSRNIVNIAGRPQLFPNI